MAAVYVSEDARMKIYVSRIPEEGVRNHATYDPTDMEMDRFDIHLRESFEVDAFIARADRELVVNVDIRAPMHLTCARCLEEFAAAITTDAVFSYSIKPDDVVDITDDLRQEIILAYPMIPMCRPDCKGLCPTCGQNLNAGPCAHYVREGQSR